MVKIIAYFIGIIIISTSFADELSEREIKYLEQSLNPISIGYYNVSPENKIEKYVLIAEFKDEFSSVLKVVNLYDNEVMHIVASTVTDIHNGLRQIWIDNEKFAYMSAKNEINVVNVNNRKEQKYKGFYLGHSSSDGELLVYSKLEERYGIYKLNVRKNKIEEILNLEKINKIYESFKGENNNWIVKDIYHPEMRDDILIFRIDVGDKNNTRQKNIISYNLTTKQTYIFNPIPLHYTLLKKNILGFNRTKPTNTLMESSLSGVVKKVYPITGNHLSVNGNENLIAYDSYYESNPVKLKIYSTDYNRSILIETSQDVDLIWRDRYHLNSSFNYSGTRLYFNMVKDGVYKIGYISSTSIERVFNYED